MKIGFLGDVHGSANHALALILLWQKKNATKLDLIIQLGDIGILPDPEVTSPPYEKYYEWNKTVYDLFYLPRAVGRDAEILKEVRRNLAAPICFILGNHDEQPRFSTKSQVAGTKTFAIDPFDIFHFAPDGAELKFDATDILLCGEAGNTSDGLGAPSAAKIVATHPGPFGIGRNTLGEVLGSRDVLSFILRHRPVYLVFGHHHHILKPTKVGKTTCVGLDRLIGAERDGSSPPKVLPGALCIYDEDSDSFSFVEDSWLADIPGSLNIADLNNYL
jgi:Icc-related predicted phosphoesterase